MFGDFARNFGVEQFLQSMRQAQQQPPFAPGQVDTQGGIFGQLGEAPTGSLHELGLGAGGAAGGPRGGGAPTAAAVAPGLPSGGGPSGGGSSPLQPGGASPMTPGARPQPGQLPQTQLEQGAHDMFQRAGQPPGGPPPQRRFEDLMR